MRFICIFALRLISLLYKEKHPLLKGCWRSIIAEIAEPLGSQVYHRRGL